MRGMTATQTLASLAMAQNDIKISKLAVQTELVECNGEFKDKFYWFDQRSSVNGRGSITLRLRIRECDVPAEVLTNIALLEATDSIGIEGIGSKTNSAYWLDGINIGTIYYDYDVAVLPTFDILDPETGLYYRELAGSKLTVRDSYDRNDLGIVSWK